MTVSADNRVPVRDVTDCVTEETGIGIGNEETPVPVQFTIHFSLALENGEIIDTTENREPVTFTIGDGNLLPGFEQAMLEQSAGEKKTYRLKPEQAFGARQDENLHTIPLYQFPADLALEKGLVVGFSDQNGNEQPGVIIEVGRTSAEIDFNHPLAGKTIMFTVEVLARSVQNTGRIQTEHSKRIY